MTDEEIRTALADLYEKIRELRKAHHTVYKMAAATSLALRQLPQFDDEYAKQWDEQSTQLDDQFSEALLGFDEKIHELRRG